MQVEVKMDASYKEPKVIVLTDKMTEEVSEILRKLSEEDPKVIVGILDDKLTVLEPKDLIRVYAADGKVFAVTEQGQEFRLKIRLYEAEERLTGGTFVRISNSEIINLKKVKHFDLSFIGTIGVSFLNGTTTYVSRRYVTKIKQKLGM